MPGVTLRPRRRLSVYRSLRDLASDDQRRGVSMLVVTPLDVPVIAFNQRAWDASPAPFDDIVDVFEQFGLDPIIQSPRNGHYGAGGVVVNEIYEVSVLLYKFAGHDLLTAIEGGIVGHYVSRKLDGKRSGAPMDGSSTDEPMIGRIYGPNHEVLREFEITGKPGAPLARRFRPSKKNRRR